MYRVCPVFVPAPPGVFLPAVGKIEHEVLAPPCLPDAAHLARAVRTHAPVFELPWASVAGKSRGCWIEKLRVAALVAAAAARVLP